MEILSLTVIVFALFTYSLISGRLEGSIFTAPMVFVLLGFLVGPGALNIAPIDADHSLIHLIAEGTLILVLFTDAARIDLQQVRDDHNLPIRMLVAGLPLAVLFGVLFAVFLFPEFSIWEAALLAALLAPTDAALGQAVVTAKVVPVRIRQAINIESGLNDGMILPVVLIFAAMAGTHYEMTSAGEWIWFTLYQVTLGPLAGIVLGYIGARLIDRTAELGWMGESFQGISIISLAILIYTVSEIIGGNGFIAVFVGGMVFGNAIRNACAFLFEFMETEGQLLMLITFVIFGAALLPEGLHYVDMNIVIYAVLSLTVIRMIPIGLSLTGSGVQLPTKLFLGWFGPRGLASILFVLLILDETEVAHHNEIFATVMLTVLLSAVLHGISAAPLAAAYGRKTETMGDCVENCSVNEQPGRDRLS